MGVPAFFRWLSRKYPSLIVDCVEEKPRNAEGERIPSDIRLPNPNNVEFDNLYLDMNGIIHPCCHPEDKPPPKDEDEMMVRIFESIDRLMEIVRPRRLLYMAIDGPAPRAKMNQQRSRRFRASKESWELKAEIAKTRAKLAEQGIHIEEKKKEAHFDSNCITPGTEFMDRLAVCLRYYIHDRLASNPGWAKIHVILSDAQCPGEGEHKIMDYIRRQRSQPDHDPNTHHCLCGADADLIMLGLATHEVHFTIIREEFKFKTLAETKCALCGQLGHELKDCDGSPPSEEVDKPEVSAEQNYIFVRLNVLRECLEKELTNHNLPFPWDLERAIDDWVFMCFFVGNDFLPHLPSLEIREGAIDRLIKIYHNVIFETKGWLSDNGYANLHRVQLIMKALGEMEDQTFKMRAQKEKSFKRRDREQKRREAAGERGGRGRGSGFVPAYHLRGQLGPQPLQRGGSSSHSTPVQNPRQAIADARLQSMQYEQRQSNANKNEQGLNNRYPTDSRKRPFPDSPGGNDDDSEDENDEVKLHQEGWKDRYYSSKFHVPASDFKFRKTLAHAYVLGLCWVLRYYYQGCPSWKWFFPFQYAPFASDFVNITEVKNEFEIGKPFQPLEQLMGVFPAASGNFLPPSWRKLMSSANSPIIDMYPTDFKVDLNGKKFAWQGVALLPFVDERRLLATLDSVYGDLTEDEIRRNTYGKDNIFFPQFHPAYNFVKGLYEGFNPRNESKPIDYVSIDPKLCYGMAATVWCDKSYCPIGGKFKSPVPGLPELTDNHVLQLGYQDLYFPPSHVYKASLLPGVKMPERVLKPGNWDNQRDGQFKPMIGFSRDMPRANLGQAGHRMLQAEGIGGPQNNSSSGAAIPPPQNYYNRGGRHSWDGADRFHRGGHGNRGGGNYNNHNYQNYSNNYGNQSFDNSNKRRFSQVEQTSVAEPEFSNPSPQVHNPFKRQRISNSGNNDYNQRGSPMSSRGSYDSSRGRGGSNRGRQNWSQGYGRGGGSSYA